MTYFLFSLIKLIVYCCLDLQSNYNTIIVHGLQLSGDSRWLTEKTKDIFDRQIFAHFWVLVITVFINMAYNSKNTMFYYTILLQRQKERWKTFIFPTCYISIWKKIDLNKLGYKPQTIKTSNLSRNIIFKVLPAEKQDINKSVNQLINHLINQLTNLSNMYFYLCEDFQKHCVLPSPLPQHWSSQLNA